MIIILIFNINNSTYVSINCILPQATAGDMDIPDLPANYVMTEFMQAKEQARMPKRGTVKNTAGDWYDTHKDMPEAPPNFVNPSDVKANTPRAGTVKNVAGQWYDVHKD